MQEFATLKATCLDSALPMRNCQVQKNFVSRQMVRIMRLTAILLLGVCMHVSARGLTQNISLTVKNADLFTVLKSIEKQTDFVFMVEKQWLLAAKKVTLSVNNLPITQVLDLCFKDQPLYYKISGKVIAIGPRKNNSNSDERSVTSENIMHPIDIRGRVLNSKGEPIPDATVSVQGGNKRTITNENGEFVITGVDENTVVTISHVQYESITLPLKGKGLLIATLQYRVSNLDELQIIAYGTTTKRFTTGNIFSVKSRDIEKQPVNNPLLALQGRVPGLFITQSSGLAGSGVAVRIQGQNSIGRGTDPFYVIDGVPYASQTLPTINSILGNSGNNAPSYISSGTGNPLSFINPADIESIEVLKDADATAIYGSRAANGAILITTKKGKSGQAKVIVNMQQGWGKVPIKLDLLNTQQYIEMRKEGKMNDNAAISATDYDINGTWDQEKYTDWQNVLLGGTSKYSDIQASVSGGNNIIQYLIGGGYHKENTVFPGDFADQKGSMHLSINSASNNQKFKTQTSINYIVDNNRLPTQDLTQRALQLQPNAPNLYTSEGLLNWEPLPNGNSTWFNPLLYVVQQYRYRVNNLLSNTTVSYKILPGLDIKGTFGYNRMQTEELQTTPMQSIAPESRASTLRSSVFGNGFMNSWILEPQLTYKKLVLKGNLEILAGATFQENKNQMEQLTARGFNSDLVMEDIKAATSIVANSSLISNYKYSAVFGRINYNWLDKYIISFTGRRDGSSRFGSANLFHNFGSLAGAWIFSKERLIEQEFHFISFGKLRVSYGTTGNDQIGDYKFLNQYISVPSIAVAYQGVPSIQPDGIPNPYLQWEETKKLQFGLDFGLFKDRILLTGNYAHNRSSNQLLTYTLPSMVGVEGTVVNFPATIENTSWEFSLSIDNLRTSNLKWTSNINLTIQRNKLVDFPNLAISTYSSLLVVGQPFILAKRYHFLGVDPASGKYVFADTKGNPTSTPTTADRNVIINASPEIYGGFQNNISYKGFELDFLFQFVKQNGTNYSFGASQPGSNVNQPVYVLDRWQKAGDITSIQRYSNSLTLQYANASSLSDAGYSDASFIRLRNASISWGLPNVLLKKMHMQNLRIFTQGQNLLTITDFKGLDPESRSINSLPILRTVTIGVQITL